MFRLKRMLGLGRSTHISTLPTFVVVEGPQISDQKPSSGSTLVVNPGTSRYQRMSAGIVSPAPPAPRMPTRSAGTLYQRRTAGLPRSDGS